MKSAYYIVQNKKKKVTDQKELKIKILRDAEGLGTKLYRTLKD